MPNANRFHVLLLVARATCYDVRHVPDPVCVACHGDIVHPTTAEPTSVHLPCFSAVEEACSGPTADAYSFCYMWNQGSRIPSDAGTVHVIQIENWKNKRCSWEDVYKHKDNHVEREYTRRLEEAQTEMRRLAETRSAEMAEDEDDLVNAAAEAKAAAMKIKAAAEVSYGYEPVPADEQQQQVEAADMWTDKVETTGEKASDGDDDADVFDPGAQGELI